MKLEARPIQNEHSTRRDVLKEIGINTCTNSGLWLERFSYDSAADGDKTKTIELAAANIKVSDEYHRHFDRWEKYVQENALIHSDRATVQGRMIVGLGAESILETSIALHRTYGVPYIPGSALKGLASAAAHRLFACDDWRKAVKDKPPGECHKIMFGDTNTAGFVTFHDALFVPSNDEPFIPLDLDVMTVHHQDYYGGGDKPPADWDSPNPISFVTARGTYLIALEGPDEWTHAAMKILAEALWEEGIGAKTAAGYGRMRLANTQRPSAEKEEEEAAERAKTARLDAERKAEAERIEREKLARADAMKDAEFIKKNISKNNAQHLIEKNFANLPADLQPSVARAIVKALKRSWFEARNEQPWVQTLLAADEKI